MELKTQVHAEDGKQEIFIRREFDLPLQLLFKAYEDAQLIEQWMGTKVKLLENRKYGHYHFLTIDPKGNEHHFTGVIHTFEPENQIIRTFEMEGTPYPVQLEFLHFEKIDEERSKLTMQVVYKSIHDRDNILKLPFKQGINHAHNRIEEILKPANS